MYQGQSCTSLMLSMSRSVSGFCCSLSTPIPEVPSCRRKTRKVGVMRASYFSTGAPPIFPFHFPVCYTYSTTLTSLQVLYNGRKILYVLQMESLRHGFCLGELGVSCGLLGISQRSLAVQILNRICNLSVPQSTHK